MRYSRAIIFCLILACCLIVFAGCGKHKAATPAETDLPKISKTPTAVIIEPTPEPTETAEPEATDEPTPTGQPVTQEPVLEDDLQAAIPVVANAAEVTVLINKSYRLPKDYKPDDLVVPNVSFIFTEKLEKRKMRKVAAEALEKLFAAAKGADMELAGVSGFRSQATQKALFHSYASRDGLEAAKRYSALPGQSEHQTGLAMDVSGINGKCPATDCFGDTKEAKWLADNAADYGFIIRYPNGKEMITGYKYEPWHLRYVGVDIAKEIHEKGITLEDYFNNAVPVSK